MLWIRPLITIQNKGRFTALMRTKIKFIRRKALQGNNLAVLLVDSIQNGKVSNKQIIWIYIQSPP